MIRHILLILKRSNIVKSTVSHVILNQITLLFFFLKQLQFFGRFIWIQHGDQLPVGLLAQLVEHCTGIAEVMGSNPIRA